MLDVYVHAAQGRNREMRNREQGLLAARGGRRGKMGSGRGIRSGLGLGG